MSADEWEELIDRSTLAAKLLEKKLDSLFQHTDTGTYGRIAPYKLANIQTVMQECLQDPTAGADILYAVLLHEIEDMLLWNFVTRIAQAEAVYVDPALSKVAQALLQLYTLDYIRLCG